ncbi:ferritin-like domain-containing protein [Congregibacter litoralis]|uniref:Ribonucleotide reductase, beta subunit n=1 Tax=Congregibacter litoralis KT71 TaxID=314285 RepID=A4A9L0_9GAMM|nr:ferritin-like domain-containing protein [Congregibacter litoralis]EAQ97177.1 Ribonucleotide reductase, beta subunit [Congregibacter litoralis KT71]
MNIKWEEQAPRKIQQFANADYPRENPDLEDLLTDEQVDHIAEIFQTPLTGSYNWDYTVQDDRIKKLYDLGKQLNWDPEMDIDWNRPWPDEVRSPELMNLHDYEPYLAMDEKTKDEFWLHMNAWSLSQFLHGEQGALLVASQLCSCAPTLSAKLYAGSQTFDEARHVEVFNKYLQKRIGVMYPINTHLKSIIDKILVDPRWDLKFIGMQIVIEGLALSAFNTTRETTPDPVLKDVVYLVTRDEARHVTFGVNYLEEHIKTLTQEEIEERAQFAYEACVVSRERLVATDVFRHFGWDVEEARKKVLDGFVMSTFRNLLFQRVIPNLSRIGLLTDKIRPKFEELGILEFENLATDGDINWSALERPLDTEEAQSHEQSMLAAFHEKFEEQANAEEPAQQVAEAGDTPQAGGCC